MNSVSNIICVTWLSRVYALISHTCRIRYMWKQHNRKHEVTCKYLRSVHALISLPLISSFWKEGVSPLEICGRLNFLSYAWYLWDTQPVEHTVWEALMEHFFSLIGVSKVLRLPWFLLHVKDDPGYWIKLMWLCIME